jgi:flavin-dependent dehydrogenase
MTQRMNLDKYLLDQAQGTGARVAENVTIRKVVMANDQASATTDNGDVYQARVIVGADGANSVVARELCLAEGVQREIALESEIALSPDEIATWNDTIEIDLFSVWCGYGWVFPKEKHISIGVGGPKVDIKRIQEYNKRYLAHHQVADLKPLRFSGHGLPVRANHLPVVSRRGLLVGDAAGLLEPFTGEGIGNAIKSGQIAAEIIGTYLQGKTDSLDAYNARLNSEVMPDLWDAQQFVRAFNRFPRLFYRLIRDNDYVWQSICKILRGERGFSDINRKLGVFKYAIRLF